MESHFYNKELSYSDTQVESNEETITIFRCPLCGDCYVEKAGYTPTVPLDRYEIESIICCERCIKGAYDENDEIGFTYAEQYEVKGKFEKAIVIANIDFLNMTYETTRNLKTNISKFSDIKRDLAFNRAEMKLLEFIKEVFNKINLNEL